MESEHLWFDMNFCTSCGRRVLDAKSDRPYFGFEYVANPHCCPASAGGQMDVFTCSEETTTCSEETTNGLSHAQGTLQTPSCTLQTPRRTLNNALCTLITTSHTLQKLVRHPFILHWRVQLFCSWKVSSCAFLGCFLIRQILSILWRPQERP